MSRPVTLAALLASARDRANMESSLFITDAQVESYIQASGTFLYDQILSAWGERYFFSQEDIDTVTFKAYINLPDDFYRLLKIGWAQGSGDPIRLEPFQDDEEWSDAFWGNAGTWGQMSPPRYQVRGNRVYFDPEPTSVETITVQYVPIMREIDDVGPPPVTFEGVNGWEEFIILDVAIKMRIKEESDVRALQQERQLQMERIKDMAPNRDVGRTPRVQRRRRMARYR